MKIKIALSIFFILAISILPAQTAKDIITKCVTALNTTNNYKYTFTTTERINGELINSTMKVKLMQNPHKIYLNNTAGKNKGKELLYVKGQNSDKVLINVAWGFSLSPFSSMVRKGNHHTIVDSGFKTVKAILADAKKRAETLNQFDQVFKYEGTVEFQGRSCYKITITDPTFTYVDYTIKSGETLYQIAKRLNVCEQLIIEKNSSLSSFDSAKEGLKIKIPSSYAKKSIIYVDTKNYHPIYQELHDEKGLFEKYSYIGLQINPTFAADEFTADFKEYNF